MSFFTKNNLIAPLLTFAVLNGVFSIAQAAQEEATVPFLYPDPRTVGVVPYTMQGTPAVPVTNDRYAGISEQERMQRMLWDQYMRECECIPGHDHLTCPLCEDDWKTPCGKCKMCVAGFPCEKTLCRHCLQPRPKTMGNSCDLTAGDEPCGTCDACREHRSDPCEHADDGYGLRGEFNPYKEVRLFSVIPRPVLDFYNNGARKFPVYYNPAPYYRPTWNPATFVGYNRPFQMRYSCELCFKDPCECNVPGMAGQVSYAFACKFCNRKPCACVPDICNVNAPMDPKGITAALMTMKGEAAGPQAVPVSPGVSTPATNGTPLLPESPTRGGGTSLEESGWFDDETPAVTPGSPAPASPGQPIWLDAPSAPAMPIPSGSGTVS